MNVDAGQFKSAIAGMADVSLQEVVDALHRARDNAAQLKDQARLPECAAFGAIARDLDYGLSTIRWYVPGNWVDNRNLADEARAAALVELITGGRQSGIRMP